MFWPQWLEVWVLGRFCLVEAFFCEKFSEGRRSHVFSFASTRGGEGWERETNLRWNETTFIEFRANERCSSRETARWVMGIV